MIINGKYIIVKITIPFNNAPICAPSKDLKNVVADDMFFTQSSINFEEFIVVSVTVV